MKRITLTAATMLICCIGFAQTQDKPNTSTETKNSTLVKEMTDGKGPSCCAKASKKACCAADSKKACGPKDAKREDNNATEQKSSTSPKNN